MTAADARAALGDFVLNRLPQFGDWQDAMRTGAPTLFHALISTSLNTGLLEPLEDLPSPSRKRSGPGWWR